jgi:hypothetical protein
MKDTVNNFERIRGMGRGDVGGFCFSNGGTEDLGLPALSSYDRGRQWLNLPVRIRGSWRQRRGCKPPSRVSPISWPAGRTLSYVTFWLLCRGFRPLIP